MTGKELIKYIQEHHLEDYTFRSEYVLDNDEYCSIMEDISINNVCIDRTHKLVDFITN